jgi:trigger factor
MDMTHKKEDETTVVETAEPALERANDAVRVFVHYKPACRVELQVEASSSLVKSAQVQAVKVVGKEVVLPGFRKGKAPEEFVLKKYSKEVDEESRKALADLAFKESLKLTQIPVLQPEPKISFDVKKYSLEGAELILSFETEPTVPAINPHDVVLKEVERPAVNADKVNETIRQVQLFFAEWKKLEEDPIQEGNFVILDVDVIETEPPVGLFSGVRFEVKDRSMAKWMKDLIIGHKAGEVLEGISIPDEDASPREKEELTEKKVRITIREVQEAKIPELTDAFAQSLGSFSVEEMYKSVEKLLTKKADDHVREKMREQVSEVLMTKYPFEIPFSLIDRETRFRINQLLQDVEFQKYWTSMTPEFQKRTVQSIAEQSTKAVRMFYLCRKIIADAKISMSPNDVQPSQDTFLDLLVGKSRNEHPQEMNEMHQAEAFSRLLLDKAEDFIISHAKIEN